MAKWPVWGIVCALLLARTPGLPAQDKYFDSNGVKIRYVERGKGEPVLLIHGFGASADLNWVLPGVVEGLAHDYRVIAFDCRGHGKSGKPHDPKKYGKEMALDAVRLLDHLKIKKAHVVGYSMGALIAAKLEVTHPDRLLSATLGGAGPYQKNDMVAKFTDLLADSLDKGKGIGPLIEVLTPPGMPKPAADQIKKVNALFGLFNDQKALAAVVRGWKELAVSDAELKANRVPTLALVGGKDPLKAGVDVVKGKMADLTVKVLPGADHVSAIMDPQFLKSVQGFLKEHAAR
jgi:pimeloyl-ACP methyl ester carboxylesterase